MELSDLKDSFRYKLLEWTILLEEEIYEMLKNSNIDEAIDKKAMASFLVSCFEGVILKTKLEKDPKSIKEFQNYVFNILIKNKQFPLIDIGIAAEHVCLQAAAEGLGSCMLGWFDEPKVKRLLNIPKSKRVPLIITIGYPASETREKRRKDKENILSYNTYK